MRLDHGVLNALFAGSSECVLVCEDDGIGIAPDLLPTIFDLFVQGERGLDRSEGGLGIGLTLARSLVESHGGTMSARSAGVGCGSTFVVRLPAPSTAPGPLPGTAAAAPPPRLARKRVLVVDDNADAVEMLAEALRSFGHEVEVAHDGPAALAVASAFRPQVAVLDIGLPAMDGYELARRLLARPEAGGLRLIALTGYGQAYDRARSRAAGFEQHLVKPVDVEELAGVIHLS